MKVILWLPLFPAIADAHNDTALPLVAGLVEEWVEHFDDHPALLGWSYGDEKPKGQISTAIDHFVLVDYNAIPAVQARFRPLFLFTADFPFEDQGGNPGPAGYLHEMFRAAHILMPNYYLIRGFNNEPNDGVPMLSQWCWSGAMHRYGFGLLGDSDPPPSIARAVPPVLQMRPAKCTQRPPRGYEARTMAAQAVAGHGVGFIGLEFGVQRIEGSDCEVSSWDLLTPANRAAWDSLSGDAATSLYEAFPDVNRIVGPFAEKRFAGDPSMSTLPPAIVTRGAYSPDSSWIWAAEDSWITPWNWTPDATHHVAEELQTGYTCHAATQWCSGFGRIRFLEMQGAFDAQRIEKADLLLTVLERLLEAPEGPCSLSGCRSYTTPMSHVCRIPGTDVAGRDSLFWSNDTTGWADFVEGDSVTQAFNHLYIIGGDTLYYKDFGLQLLASGRRDFGQRIGIISQPFPSHRIVDFDLTNTVRYWVADTTSAERRNNGLFIQPYSPTRRFEPHILYESSDAYPAPSAFHPSILIYQVPQDSVPKALGAPFALFYEAPPKSVRIYELAHLSELSETWIAAINGRNSEQCLRLYSNGHPVDPPPPALEVMAPRTGQIIQVVQAQTSDAEYINFAPDTLSVTLCPDTLSFGIDDTSVPIETPWHPPREETYQPLTRWDLSLPESSHEWSAVLIRIPHPSS